jgi:acyl-CoA synthetase (AMP-forming)/AMP-acid ligase II
MGVAAAAESLVQILQWRAQGQSDQRAYVFVADRGVETAALTFGDLDRRARAVAAQLVEMTRSGDRALLLFPPGLDFLVAFFGCLYAGVVAVPAVPPRRTRVRDSTATIASDCVPRVAITADNILHHARAQLDQTRAPRMQWLSVDLPSRNGQAISAPPPARRSDLAFLQYTSGSTTAPKGVMVSHRQLLANLEMIRRAFGTEEASTYASWIPLFHDMGLILVALQALYAGATCIFMAPTTFVQRPWLWLWAIHDYRARVAGGPNFAYDTCVAHSHPERLAGLDLSHWQVAFNGAEPVHAETLDRFVTTFARYGFGRRAFYPCYGMAEATVMISGGDVKARPRTHVVDRDALQRGRAVAATSRAEAQTVVGCGRALHGERIVIVDPVTARPCDPRHVGEIWVSGPNVAAGYWQNPTASAATFNGYLAGSGEGPFLRTGDLGFVDADGELYPTGRLKEIIIVRGRNYYPQDIEWTIERSHSALRAHAGAVFTVSGRDGQDRLVVVQEIDPTVRSLDCGAATAAIRKAVVEEHELTVHTVVLIRPGTVPKTSSGKIQRNATREQYLDGELSPWSERRVAHPQEVRCVESS